MMSWGFNNFIYLNYDSLQPKAFQIDDSCWFPHILPWLCSLMEHTDSSDVASFTRIMLLCHSSATNHICLCQELYV